MCIHDDSNNLFLLECEKHFTKIIINSGSEPECFWQKDELCSFKAIGRVYVPENEITWIDEKPDDANKWIEKLNLGKCDNENVLLVDEKMKKNY